MRGSDSGAGNSIVESKYPHPSAFKQMVHSCIIDRIRRCISRTFRTRDSCEMAVEAFCSGETGQGRFLQLQSAVQKTARAGGINQKPGLDVKWLIA